MNYQRQGDLPVLNKIQNQKINYTSQSEHIATLSSNI